MKSARCRLLPADETGVTETGPTRSVFCPRGLQHFGGATAAIESASGRLSFGPSRQSEQSRRCSCNRHPAPAPARRSRRGSPATLPVDSGRRHPAASPHLVPPRQFSTARRQIVPRHWTPLPDLEPVCLAFNPSQNDHIVLCIETGVKLVAGGGGCQRGRNAHAAFGIKRNNHGGIVPLDARTVNGLLRRTGLPASVTPVSSCSNRVVSTIPEEAGGIFVADTNAAPR